MDEFDNFLYRRVSTPGPVTRLSGTRDERRVGLTLCSFQGAFEPPKVKEGVELMSGIRLVLATLSIETWG